MKNLHISIVVPVYGCSNSLETLYKRLNKSLSTVTDSFEIIMINDASPDDAWDTIKELSKQNSRVIGINFSRNFGQHYAITAGLERANKAQEGYDIVFGQRKNRQDSFLKKLGSKLFYKLLSYLTNTKQDSSIANFGIYSKSSIDAVLSMGDKLKCFPVMIRWVGFKSSTVTIKHASREEGKSSYSLSSLISLSIDIMLSFSDKPLKLAVKSGFIISTLSFIISLVILIKALVTDYIVPGWASTIMSLWFLGGLIIMVLGIVGIYVGKTFNQVKDRPSYLIQETTNDKIRKDEI